MLSCPECGSEMDPDEVACAQCGHSFRPDSPYRTAYTREELLALGLTPVLVDFVFLDPKPRPFTNWCEPRDAGWPGAWPEEAASVYPLWTCNGDVTAACVRGGRVGFFKLCHDDPEPIPLAATEQGLLARLFLPLIESPRATPAGLRRAAALVGFRHLDELTGWHERNGSRRDFQDQFDRLVQSIDKSHA